MIRARLRDAGPERDACILNLSPGGLAASAQEPPSRGSYVELAIGQHKLVGQVRWTSARRFGIAFREKVSVIGLISGEDGPVEIKLRNNAARKAAREQQTGSSIGRRVEFVVFAAAGAAATFYIADFVFSALGSLDLVAIALSGGKASG